MANTGLRVGEITGLRWRDIDLEEGIIQVMVLLLSAFTLSGISDSDRLNQTKVESAVILHLFDEHRTPPDNAVVPTTQNTTT